VVNRPSQDVALSIGAGSFNITFSIIEKIEDLGVDSFILKIDLIGYSRAVRAQALLR
jgi:hypothetical protein